MHIRFSLIALLTVAVVGGPQPASQHRNSYQFDFGPGKIAPGYRQVLPTTIYSRSVGYGFEPGAMVRGVDHGGSDPLTGDSITSDQPFYFSVALPEGNYDVTVVLGDA